jgi:hypothetical protein
MQRVHFEAIIEPRRTLRLDADSPIPLITNIYSLSNHRNKAIKTTMKSGGRLTYGQRHSRRDGKSPLGEHNHRKPKRRTNFICNAIKKDSTPSRNSPLAAPPRVDVPKMNECTSIETMVQVAFDNFLQAECGQLRDIAAFWARSLKIIDDKDHVGVVNDKQQTLMQLKALRNYTVKHIELFEPADFSKSFLALAKIFSSLTSKQNDVGDRDDIDSFRCLLLDVMNGEQPNENPFQFFVYASMPLLPQLLTRDLTCISYALSLLSWHSSLKDADVLLDAVSSEVVSRVNQFDSRSLSRILFDVAKSGQSQPLLFSVVGSYLCDMDAFVEAAPGEMSMILYAYATANESNPTIFQKIAAAVVDQYSSSTRLAWYKCSDLSTILWSYARAGEQPPEQFQKKMHNALFAKLFRMHEVFSLEDLSDVIWALSKYSSNQSSLLTKIAKRINLNAQSLDYTATSITQLLWTCCESNVHVEDLFCQDSAFMTACFEKREEYKDDELRKLYEFHLWQQELNCDGLPPALHDKCFVAHLLPINLLSGYE